MSIKSGCNLKKTLFVLNATAEYVDCSLFFEKYSKIFLQFDSQKTSSSTLKIYRNIYGKKLSAIIYRSSISLKKLRFIDYRYCFFTTESFIVPISDSGYGSAICMLQRLNILFRLPFSIPSFHPLLTFEDVWVEIANNKNIAEAQ